MKISVSLSESDLHTLDEYARVQQLTSRSAAVQRAIELLRSADLEDDYAAAFDEWRSSGDEEAWAGTAGDGLIDASR